MQPDTKQFLVDVFDIRDLSAENINQHIVQSDTGMMVNMHSLFRDPMLRTSLSFRRFWHAVLKTHPSFETTSRFLASLPSEAWQGAINDTIMMQRMAAYIQSVAPVFNLIASRMYPEGYLPSAYKESVAFMSDPVNVKMAIAEKFALRFGRTAPVTEDEHSQHLLRTYQAMWKESCKLVMQITSPVSSDIKIDSIRDYYSYSDVAADLLNINHRIGVDVLTGYQSDAFAIRMLGNLNMTLFDIASHACVLNGCLMTLLIGSHCVFVDDSAGICDMLIRETAMVLRAINEREETGNIVLLANQDMINAIQSKSIVTLGFGVHMLRLIHPCLLAYLPKVAATFASIQNQQQQQQQQFTSSNPSLAAADRTVCYIIKPVAKAAPAAPAAPAVAQAARLVYGGPTQFAKDLAKFCIRRKFTEQPHEKLYHDFVTKYCAKNMQSMADAKSAIGAKYAIVIVDNRSNFLNIVAAKACLMNLKTNEWEVVVYCREQDANYYRTSLGNEICVITDAHLPPQKRFSMAFYNDLLKSPSFWAKLLKYKRVIMAQDDGFLLKPGVEDEFLEYDYVGAPWSKDMQFNSYMNGWGIPDHVGNGGLSLRNPSAMLEICSKHSVARKTLFFDGMQAEPEDVFFAKMCHKKGFKVPSYEKAQRFSSEEIMADSYGFHKVFGYFPPNDVAAFFQKYL